jgi:ABC-type multidrug transport system fused ATPase/permease subunit
MRFSENTADLALSLISLDKIQEYFNLPNQEALKLNDTELIDPSWPARGHIKFVNFSNKYRADSSYVIKNLSLEIMPRETVGIVGKSGSGKTSIFFSLLRLFEYSEGSIFIDDINIKNVGLHDLRSKITLITKDPILLG